MKKMQIFEPAMCCSTGLCGVGVDPELLRISTVINSIKKNGATIERFNLSDAPQEFVDNKVVNDILNTKGVDDLPLTILDGEVVITGRYPTNEELVKLLDIPTNFLGEKSNNAEVQPQSEETGGCGCSGGDCC